MNIFKNLKEGIKNIWGEKTKMPDGTVVIKRRPLSGKWNPKVEEGQVEPISVPKLVTGILVGGAAIGGGVYEGKKLIDSKRETVSTDDSTTTENNG